MAKSFDYDRLLILSRGLATIEALVGVAVVVWLFGMVISVFDATLLMQVGGSPKALQVALSLILLLALAGIPKYLHMVKEMKESIAAPLAHPLSQDFEWRNILPTTPEGNQLPSSKALPP